MGCCGSAESKTKSRSAPQKQGSSTAQRAAPASGAPAHSAAAPATAPAPAAGREERAASGAGISALRKAGGQDSPTKGISLLRAAQGVPVDYHAKTVQTVVHQGQKPGTSGLRKKTREFMKEHYLENFVQCVFDTLKADAAGWAKTRGKALVVSGDGRYHNKVAVQVIIRMAVANGVQKIWVGQHGLLSTPAVSAVIREHGGGGQSFGGFILSASHNPGGIDEDFGIKYNCENGGPAPEKVTNEVARLTGCIKEYHTCEGGADVDLATTGTTTVTVHSPGGGKSIATVDVFDNAQDHVDLLRKQFDFAAIRRLVQLPQFSMVYDCMCGVQGPYAKRVFLEELGAKPGSLMNEDPKEDFGGKASAHGGHADPNLTYAKGLVKAVGLTASGRPAEGGGPFPDFGAAADGDADRNMICGSQWFVSPSDSLAIICANHDVIPGLRGLRGCARSMPTSGALDRVARDRGVDYFEVPTGWKFFGNLMDSGNPDYFPGKPNYCPFLCGEESFGTGSSHCREKDGMWAALAWLQILADKNKGKGPGDTLVSVADVCREHWRKYGRNYYVRYDYEGVDKAKADEMMAEMKAMTEEGPEKHSTPEFRLASCDMFCYEDPVDGSVSANQGIRWIMEDGSRIVFRLSGTGTAGATIRLYLEQYVDSSGDLGQHAPDVVRGLALRAMQLSKIPERYPERAVTDGISEPSVIT